MLRTNPSVMVIVLGIARALEEPFLEETGPVGQGFVHVEIVVDTLCYP